jgi:hypothetical protein
MTLMMCPITGRPYSFGHDGEKVYEVPSISIPEHLRSYLQGRGRCYQPYVEEFNAEDLFDVSVDTFLESYPEWDKVLEYKELKDLPYSSDWTQYDHKMFQELLEYLVKLPVSFRVCWSY